MLSGLWIWSRSNGVCGSVKNDVGMGHSTMVCKWICVTELECCKVCGAYLDRANADYSLLE